MESENRVANKERLEKELDNIVKKTFECNRFRIGICHDL